MDDVVIIGGSAAGLSAALTLGRVRREVLVIDGGKPRNAPAHAVHNFFTREGTPPPADLYRIGREQLEAFPTVRLQAGDVVSATAVDTGFEVTLADGTRHPSKKLLLATGIRDELPTIPGVAELWGSSVYHCPYCHGWEARDQAVAIVANGGQAVHLAVLLHSLTDDLAICTNGVSQIEPGQREKLAGWGVRVYEQPIERLQHHDDSLQAVVFADGSALPRQAVFTSPTPKPNTDLAVQLGCRLTETGLIQVETGGKTSVHGVYAAGDIANPAAQVIQAAGQGSFAAAMLNHELATELFEQQAMPAAPQ